MYLTEYKSQNIDNFMGLWNRNSLDDIPLDHASDILNMAFARKRETLTRPGASLSRGVPGNVTRQFIACFDNGKQIPIHLDGTGTIWRDDLGNSPQAILSIPNMVDMACLNMNNVTFIAPILSQPPAPPGPSPTQVAIYVWVAPDDGQGTLLVPRLAAGIAPQVTNLVLSVSSGGITGPGWYGVSYSYVTNTGYVSAPGRLPQTQTNTMQWPTINLTGSSNQIINVGPINCPPSAYGGSVTSVIIWVTKGVQAINGVTDAEAQALAGNAQLFQYPVVFDIANCGPTSVVGLNFLDGSLNVSADALPGNGSVLNNLQYLPNGWSPGSVALAKYRGRMFIIGTGTQAMYTYDPNNIGNPPTVTPYVDDRIWVSNVGQAETFNELTGYLLVQYESDSNTCRSAFELFGALYITKGVGTYVTSDSGAEPNDPTNPWIVSLVDGGIGAFHHGIGTITGSQPSLSFNSTGFLANYNGLFLFNGNVLRPELSWKIRGLWSTITYGYGYNIRVEVDIFNDIFYVLLPTNGSTTPNLLLMGDYSLGLDSQNIRWSVYTFPWVINDIMMGEYVGDVTGVTGYYLRLGIANAIMKLDGATNFDYGVNPINCYYQLAPLTVGDIGSVNIYRFVRYRCSGTGSLYTEIYDQGENVISSWMTINPLAFPGNYMDQGIQINFSNEKAIVRFGMNAASQYFTMARVDVFGKARWPTRPNG